MVEGKRYLMFWVTTDAVGLTKTNQTTTSEEKIIIEYQFEREM